MYQTKLEQKSNHIALKAIKSEHHTWARPWNKATSIIQFFLYRWMWTNIFTSNLPEYDITLGSHFSGLYSMTLLPLGSRWGLTVTMPALKHSKSLKAKVWWFIVYLMKVLYSINFIPRVIKDKGFLSVLWTYHHKAFSETKSSCGLHFFTQKGSHQVAHLNTIQ